MFKSKIKLFFLLMIVLPAAGRTVSYGQHASPAASPSSVLSKVNGTPIGQDDLLHQLNTLRGRGRSKITPEYKKMVLEGIIRDEIIYQRAVELGFDADPAYRKELRRVQVQVNAFKRKKLADLFFKREITLKATVSDEEVKQYFARNASRMRTELHVWQILKRKERQITKTLNDLEKGASFEEVAAKQFPKLPKLSRKPWDLGYLKWKQIPEVWQSVVYDLKKGEHSGIIRGPNRRFWIIKLVDRRENPNISHSDVKNEIKDILKNEKVREHRKNIVKVLREKARVEYFKQPIAAIEEKKEK